MIGQSVLPNNSLKLTRWAVPLVVLVLPAGMPWSHERVARFRRVA